ncbi:MAG: hypothetical protein KF852_04535 [Saprospiraceae bacterium]|nr:hypothetical protein [Saprospiraceae bacterium]
MSRQQFEAHLRCELQQHPSDLDTDALWQALEPELLQGKNRTRTRGWWFFGLLWAVCAAGLATGDQLCRIGPVEKNHIPEAVFSQPVGSQAQTPPALNATGTAEALEAPFTGIELARASFPLVRPAHAQFHRVFTTRETGRPIAQVPPPADDPAFPASAPTLPYDEPALPPTTAIVPFLNETSLAPLPLLPPGVLYDLYRLPDFSKRKRKRKEKDFAGLMQMTTGAGIVNKSLRLRGDQSSDYLAARRETEQALEYIGAGLMGGIRHRSGFYALGGLHYTRISERFSLSRSWTGRDTIPDGITEIIVHPAGDSTVIYGETPVLREFTYRKRSYNTYTLWDVPVVAGYELARGRWTLAAESGLWFNAAMIARGELLDAAGEVISMKDAGIFRPRIGLSYHVALRVAYLPGKNTQVFAASSLRFLPGSFTEREYGIVQSYTLPGLTLGLSRKF